jgi:hypothetical protein
MSKPNKRRAVQITAEQMDRLNAALPAVLAWVETNVSPDMRRQFNVKAIRKACSMADDIEGLTTKCGALDWLFGFLVEINHQVVIDETDPVADGLSSLGRVRPNAS